jgi:formylglycine-generating enzyme required for sulfatase activity
MTSATDDLGLAFIPCPTGSVSLRIDRTGDERAFTVNLTRSFSLATAPVTQATWTRVMGDRPWLDPEGRPRGDAQVGDRYPAVWISWLQAEAFCAKLGALLGGQYALPTEAQWEYAYRAGTTTKYYWGDDRDLAPRYAVGAWMDRATLTTYRASLVPVGSKPANPWGFQDMAGPVYEWVRDQYEQNANNPHIKDGTYPIGATVDDWCGSRGTKRMLRNVGFRMNASNATASTKTLRDPDYCFDDVGFRVARL